MQPGRFIDNAGACLSWPGRKIYKITDRNKIGLALIMDVIKAEAELL